MYLTDSQIHRRLDEFDFTAEPGLPDFDAHEQVGPCSIDLRLSGTYWRPEPPRPWRLGRRLPIDLTRAKVMEARPNRGWRREEARPTDVLTLRPGAVLLARTCERFQIPDDCAAAIEGRSSYARLGLSVHASGGFINPGYVGQMPLTLINHSPFTLRVPVGIALCQLMIIPLDAAPKRAYSDTSPKYLPDLGGPSYWWRDQSVRRLHQKLTEVRYDDETIDTVVDLFRRDYPDDSVLERMEAFLVKTPALTAADDLLRDFGVQETRKFYFARGLVYSCRGLLAGWAGIAAPYLLWDDEKSRLGTWLTLAVGLGCLLATVWGWWQKVPQYLTTDRLAKMRLERAQDAQSDPDDSSSGPPSTD